MAEDRFIVFDKQQSGIYYVPSGLNDLVNALQIFGEDHYLETSDSTSDGFTARIVSSNKHYSYELNPERFTLARIIF